MILRLAMTLGAVSLMAMAAASAQAPVAPAGASAQSPLARGTYLMNGIVACGNCHTPQTPQGPVPGKELAGGTPFREGFGVAYAPNITPDPETGIGKWTDQQIITAIREGKRPDGTIIGPPMPVPLYRDMSDEDVQAIVAYIRAVPAVVNKVAKSEYTIPLPPAYGPPITAAVTAPPKSDKVAYGAYLAGPLGHCIECHSSPGARRWRTTSRRPTSAPGSTATSRRRSPPAFGPAASASSHPWPTATTRTSPATTSTPSSPICAASSRSEDLLSPRPGRARSAKSGIGRPASRCRACGLRLTLFLPAPPLADRVVEVDRREIVGEELPLLRRLLVGAPGQELRQGEAEIVPLL
jgi:mono/diheme cytochrome c family protein